MGSVIAGYQDNEEYYWNQVSNPNALSHGVWHHVLYTKNSLNHSYYLDGKLINQSHADELIDAVSDSAPIIIGDSAVNTDFDEVRIYNYSLTKEEAIQRYNSYKSLLIPSYYLLLE